MSGRTLFKRVLANSLESAGVVDDTPAVDPDHIPGEPDVLATTESEVLKGDVEIAEAEAELIEEEQKVETLEDAARSLENLINHMELTLESEQFITPGHASALSMAAKNIVGDVFANPIMDTSAFSSESQSVESTEFSIEKVKDIANRVWEAIKAAIKAVVDAIANLVKSIFTNVGRIEAHAKKVEAAADKVDFSKMKDGAKVSVSDAMLKSLYVDDESDSVDAAVEKVASNVEANLKTIQTISHDMIKGAGDVIRSMSGVDADSTDDFMSKVRQIIEPKFEATKKLSAVKNIPGRLKAEVVEVIVTDDFGVEHTKLVEEDDKATLSYDGTPLDENQVKSILSNIGKLTKAVDMKREMKQMTDDLKKAEKELNKVTSQEEADGKVMQVIQRIGMNLVTRSMLNESSAMIGTVVRHYYNHTRAALEVAQKSVQSYEAKSA